jgi:hypothetical protein
MVCEQNCGALFFEESIGKKNKKKNKLHVLSAGECTSKCHRKVSAGITVFDKRIINIGLWSSHPPDLNM